MPGAELLKLSIIRSLCRKPRSLNHDFSLFAVAFRMDHLEETTWAILAQIVPPSVCGVAPDCYLTGLGLISSQNAQL
jgi:hypothetical protein